MAILTATQVKNWLQGVDASSSTDDTLIGEVIAAVDAAFGHYCGYPPAATGANPTMEDTTYTLYLSGPGGSELRLPVAPVVSITSIEDDPLEAFDGSSELVSSSDYVSRGSDADIGIVRLLPSSAHGAWSSNNARTIKAVVVAGYETVPAAVTQAARLWVQHVYAGVRTTQGAENASGPNGSTTFRPETMPDSVRQLMKPYRLKGTFFA